MPRLTRSDRRRSRWIWVQVITFVVGLGFVLWGADALARMGAESQLQRNVQNATGVIQTPEVHVRGFFFLPQVIRGAYQEVDVTTHGITSGPLRLERVDSTLYDVRVPFHDVLLRDIRRVGIARSEQVVTMRYVDLNAYLKATGRPLELSSAAEGELKLTGTLSILGQQVQTSADASLTVANGEIEITPREINTGTTSLNRASRLLLGQRLTLSVPMTNLPFGYQLTGVEPFADGVRVEAIGEGVILRP